MQITNKWQFLVKMSHKSTFHVTAVYIKIKHYIVKCLWDKMSLLVNLSLFTQYGIIKIPVSMVMPFIHRGFGNVWGVSGWVLKDQFLVTSVLFVRAISTSVMRKYSYFNLLKTTINKWKIDKMSYADLRPNLATMYIHDN